LTIGDPIPTSTGEITASAVDLSLGGPLPLQFARVYGSALSRAGVNSALGTNWMHNFDASLKMIGSMAIVTTFPGKVVQFERTSSGGGAPASPEQTNYQLVAFGSGFQFLNVSTGLIYSFIGNGMLVSVQDRNNNTLGV